MKKYFFIRVVSLALVITCISFAADCPIIFVHGQKGGKGGKANPDEAWPDWNGTDYNMPYRTAMDKILAEHYGGYTKGSPLDCHVNTELTPTGGETRKIYNFSYYNPDGSPGVIGSNGNLVPVEDEWREKYEESASHACWAKHLADFIDKVLEATGAEKVDIVAHSMGGLVARAAIKWYGCENKVRKLLLIGTPNQGWNKWGGTKWMKEMIAKHEDWQIYGEDLEMNIDPGYRDHEVYFRNVNTGKKERWVKFLTKPKNIEIAVIIGNIEGEDDGVVRVVDAKLSYAKYQPIVHLGHGWSKYPHEERCELVLPILPNSLKNG